MKNMGEVFKILRNSRNISLKEATGNEFSHSMLSRFENGESDITVTKLLVALKNIRTELSEFMYLINGFNPSEYNLLKQELWEATSDGKLEKIKTLYFRELACYNESKEDLHFFNALTIKGQMLFLDESIKLTSEEQEFIYNYLFSIDIWGEFELKLFFDIAVLLPIDLYLRYTREMLGRVDYLGEISSNKNIIHNILLNGLFKSLQERELVTAAYFDKMIRNNFFEENDAYLRIVYLFADGQHIYCRGAHDLGLKQMEEAVHVLKLLGCQESAEYYSNRLKIWLEEF